MMVVVVVVVVVVVGVVAVGVMMMMMVIMMMSLTLRFAAGFISVRWLLLLAVNERHQNLIRNVPEKPVEVDCMDRWWPAAHGTLGVAAGQRVARRRQE